MGVAAASAVLFRHAGAALLAAVLLLGCGGARAEEPAPKRLASAAPEAPKAGETRAPHRDPPIPTIEEILARSGATYVAIGPRELLLAMEPLFVHRGSQGAIVERLAVEDLLARRRPGASDERAVAAGITAVAARSGTRLRFVLLVGDVPAPGERAEGFTPTPAFYLPKAAYGAGPSESHFASDWPYAYAHRGAPGQPDLAEERAPPPLAVGRVPARTPQEARDFAQKAIAYETAKSEGAWRRRVEVVGGAADFGPVADYLIERMATNALDAEVPYDYDVRVLFPKLDSPYAYPFPSLRHKVASDLNEGALIAAYVGHGAPTSFAYVRHGYRYFTVSAAEDMDALRIPEGKPFFVSITCDTGAYDLAEGRRSMAEAMVMNPGGPIAVFASSRTSHPYPNSLYGQAFVDAFLKARAPTVGEGIIEVKRRMREGDIPLAPLLFESDPEVLSAEHEGLYNLFGDPATRLRYPARADLSMKGAPGDVAPGAALTVTLEAPAVPEGRAELTIETRRTVIRGALVAPEKLKVMPEADAWAAMARNYAVASDKVVARSVQPVKEGRATFRVKAPKEPGEYILKALAAGGGEAAAGHVRVRVAEPAGRAARR